MRHPIGSHCTLSAIILGLEVDPAPHVQQTARGKNLELQKFDGQSKMWIEHVLFAATIDKGTTTEAYQIKDEVPILLLCWKILNLDTLLFCVAPGVVY